MRTYLKVYPCGERAKHVSRWDHERAEIRFGLNREQRRDFAPHLNALELIGAEVSQGELRGLVVFEND